MSGATSAMASKLPVHLNDVWIKDYAASDSMDAASKMMDLGFLTRKAVK